MAAVAATPFSIKDFFKSFMLWELFKGSDGPQGFVTPCDHPVP